MDRNDCKTQIVSLSHKYLIDIVISLIHVTQTQLNINVMFDKYCNSNTAMFYWIDFPTSTSIVYTFYSIFKDVIISDVSQERMFHWWIYKLEYWIQDNQTIFQVKVSVKINNIVCIWNIQFSCKWLHCAFCETWSLPHNERVSLDLVRLLKFAFISLPEIVVDNKKTSIRKLVVVVTE